MENVLIGTVILFAGNYAPQEWAFCHGQLLPVAEHPALFSLLRYTYGMGEDGASFALPDLRGRSPISAGQGPSLQDYPLGEAGGQEQVLLDTATLPAHGHPARTTQAVQSGPGGEPSPEGNYLGASQAGNFYASQPAGGAHLAPGALTTTVDPTGGNQPHENRAPYLALHYIIALEGIYPAVGGLE